jgi:hypothetical protein
MMNRKPIPQRAPGGFVGQATPLAELKAWAVSGLTKLYWRVFGNLPEADTPAPRAINLTALLRNWLATQQGEFTMTHAVHGALGLRREDLSRDEITRIGIILTRLGCEGKVTRQGQGRRVRMWSPPKAMPSIPQPMPERRQRPAAN